jgi:membrane protein YdbS with pleckstrin-like domain
MDDRNEGVDADAPDAAEPPGGADTPDADSPPTVDPDEGPGTGAAGRGNTGAAGAGDGGDGDPGGGHPADVEAYTTDLRTLSPRVRIQWGFRVLLTALLVAVVGSAVVAQLEYDPRLAAAVAVALGLLGLVWVALRYRVWAYEVRTDTLYLQRGVFTHTRTLAPYVRIQHVDTSRGPLERALGLSTLVVYTAGSRGADVSVPGLTPEEATDLQDRLKELAIEAEGGDAV